MSQAKWRGNDMKINRKSEDDRCKYADNEIFSIERFIYRCYNKIVSCNSLNRYFWSFLTSLNRWQIFSKMIYVIFITGAIFVVKGGRLWQHTLYLIFMECMISS